MKWEVGQKLIRDNSPELGVGVIVEIEGRFIDVLFPDSDTKLRLSPDAAGVRPITIQRGQLVQDGDDEVVVESVTGQVATLSNGRKASVDELWPIVRPPTLLDRLEKGDLDPLNHIQNRLDGMELLNMRRKGVVASLLGGRVELFPHQLDTAARAIQDDTVRWLLADEVGLGKTIVACMITSAMVRMGRVERVLIVAPDTLTVQWLGELYRKFHQVFVHVDAERIQDVRIDFGPEVNPFDIHPLAIVSYELLEKQPGVFRSLSEAPPQMVVVDEAHQFVDAEMADMVLPLVASAQHALLLTATPFQAGREGFQNFVEALDLPVEDEGGVSHVSHVSAVTRADIHALGERKPEGVDIDGIGDLGPNDPRVEWLVDAVKMWKSEGKRALVFVNDAARAIKLEETLTRLLQIRLFCFHEEMGTGERDVELARFRLSNSPVLVSSGAGSEGRNFQFCDVQVHVDLPDDPVVLEQRIGRVDRIGRTADIPIFYFRYDGPGAQLARAYEELGIFADASIGASPAMARLREELQQGEVDIDELEALLEDTQKMVEKEAGSWKFVDSHSKEDSERILAQIPEDLELLIEKFCCESADEIGLEYVEKEGQAAYFFEYTSAVEIDNIPGLDHGARFLGTFDRAEAVQNDMFDFFANGHELVEALLAELEDSKRGRVYAFQLPKAAAPHLRGLYVLVVENIANQWQPRIIPIAHAGRVPAERLNVKKDGERILAAMPSAPPLAKAQAKAFYGKAKAHPALASIDPEQLEMVAVFVAT